MASTDARPVPIKNTAFRAVFPILDADGDLVTGATGLDSEVSKDQGTFTDCTNEATEIATSSGMYYLDLSSTEMNADCVAVIVKTSSSGAKTTVLVFYPEETGDINVDVTAYGGSAGTFSSGRPEVNTTHAAGTAWNSGAIAAATLAADAITAAKVADGTIDAATFAAGAINAAAIAADAIGASELAADAVAEIADAVWDEAMSGHVTLGTYGQVLRANGLTGEVNTGSATTSAFAVDGFTEATDDHFNGMVMVFTSGANAGEGRVITDYTGSSQTMAFGQAWTDAPADNDDFVIVPGSQLGGTLAQVSRLFLTLLSASGEIQATTLATDTITAAKIAADAIGSSEFAQAAADKVWSTSARILTAATNITSTGGTTVPQTGDSFARLGAPAGASVSADIAAIEAQTDDIGVAGAGLTAVPWNASWDAEVQSEVDDALVAQRLDELLNADSDIDGAAPPTVGSVFHELMTKTAGSFTYDQTTDALEAIRDRGDAAWTTGAGGSAPTAAEIADAVWDEATAGHTTSGTFGEQVKTDIDDILTDTGTTLQGELDGIQSDTEDIQTRLPAALVSGRIDASVGAMAADVVTAAAIAADAIGSSELAASAVTEIQSGLSTLDAAGVRSAVGLASANLDTQLTAIDDFLDTEVAAIKAKTDNLPTDPADQSAVEAAIDAAEAAILAAIPSASTNAVALLDTADGVETSITPRQAIRLILAASAGKLSGAATSTVVIRNVGDSKDRITALVDADGNRSAVTVDVT